MSKSKPIADILDDMEWFECDIGEVALLQEFMQKVGIKDLTTGKKAATFNK